LKMMSQLEPLLALPGRYLGKLLSPFYVPKS